MSVKDFDKKIIVTDAMTGDVIFSYDIDLFNFDTKAKIITDLYYDYVEGLDHGLLIKVGYKP